MLLRQQHKHLILKALCGPKQPTFLFSTTRHRSLHQTHANCFESYPTKGTIFRTQDQDDSNTQDTTTVQEPIDERTKLIADRLLSGDRSALSKAITMIESKRYEDHMKAQSLLQYVMREYHSLEHKARRTHRAQSHEHHYQPYYQAPSSSSSLTSAVVSGKQQETEQVTAVVDSSSSKSKDPARDHFDEGDLGSFRIGVSGPPGAGKSTFIECLGQLLIRKGHRVAVLAVDPSSTRTGGSILGDKTRMNELARSENAFVRPSPSQGFLGGVTANMYEIILLCECAGYDRVLVETVGVGQSETQVADLTDMVLLLVPPAGGDELQGIKRGIVEVADLIVVNKTDGNLIPVAKRSQREYQRALHLLSPPPLVFEKDDPFLRGKDLSSLKPWYPDVMCCSSSQHVNFPLGELGEEGKFVVSHVMDKMNEYKQHQQENGQWFHRRKEQRKGWLWKQVHEDLVTRLTHHNDRLKNLVKDLQNRVGEGVLSPRLASEQILKEFVASEQQKSNNQ